MALRLGIGDVFTLCKGAVDICISLPHQSNHKETTSIIAEMQLMRSHLQNLEAQIGDESLFASTRPDIAPIIKRSLQPLHRELAELKDIMHQHQEYVQRKQSVHVMDQVRYLVMYKAKLQGFRDKMPTHRESICVIRDLIQGDSESERRRSVLRLGEIIEGHEEQTEKAVEYERAQREALRIWEQNSDQRLSTTEILGQVEEGLIAKGVSQERAKEQWRPITKAVLMQDSPTGAQEDQKPEFKLDLFDQMPSVAHVGDLHLTELSEISDETDDDLRMSEDVREVSGFIPEITRRLVSRSNTTSPVSFLAQRRPLLDSRTRSFESLHR